MTRDLIGLIVLATLCIMISPLYKGLTNTYLPNKLGKSEKLQKPMIHYVDTKETVKTTNPKKISLLTDSFLPVTYAGSEISVYETIKYLRMRGHTINVFVNRHKVNEFDGFPIYKLDMKDPTCASFIENSDIIFYQMHNESLILQDIKNKKIPIYIFVHGADSYTWILQNKMPFPIFVVYNSHMTQDLIPSLYDNMRMIPYVDTAQFKPLRTLTIQNDVVCLINCDKNKGGQLFTNLANKMSDVQFLGIKGGYGIQVIEKSPPPNLTYMETQKDIKVVFRQIGILLMPSRVETWGRAAVEAMSSGIPVIHSEAAGLVECVSGAGIMMPRDDEDGWMNAIRRILGDRAYRERLRQNGFQRVKEIESEQSRGRQELAYKLEKSS